MGLSDVTGSLASGGRYRATGYLVEITDASGQIIASLDTNNLSGVQRTGDVVTLQRIGDTQVTVTAASLEDAGRLEQSVRASIAVRQASPAPQQGGGGFRKILKWGCLGILGLAGLCMVIAIIVTLVTDDSDEDTPAAAVQETVTQAPAADDDAQEPEAEDDTDAPAADEATSEAQDEPTATPEPEPTATPGAVGSGRSNPLPLGETGETDEWEVQVLEVVRGEEAFHRLVEANQFNDPPLEGYEYVLVNLRVKYVGDSNEAQNVDRTWFRSTGDARVKHARPSVVQPEPELNASLFPDAEASGWVALTARQGEGNLIAIFEPWLSLEEGDEIFLALDEGANVPDLTERIAEENDRGFDRAAPIPLGERAVGDTWELWVIESVRGEEALARVKETNQFNDDPAPGMEYVLVRIGARNVKPDSGSDSITEYSFKLTGDAGRVYDNPSVVNPRPEISYDVYAGGEVDGWVALQAAEGEQNLKVVYEPLFSFTAKPRYFALD